MPTKIELEERLTRAERLAEQARAALSDLLGYDDEDEDEYEEDEEDEED